MRRYHLLIAAALCLGIAIGFGAQLASAQVWSMRIHVPIGQTLIVTMDNDAVISIDCQLGIRATKAAGRSTETITCIPFDVAPVYESGKEAMLWQ